jgi:putative ABC transport system permease protein
VLLLDEPTASLDDATARAFEGLVADWLGAGEGRGVVWTSHHDDQLDRIGGRRLRLESRVLNDPAYIRIGLDQVAWAAGLIVVNVALSWALRLGLARTLVVASVRMTVQLLLVGLVLAWIFALNQPLPILAIALFMATLASVSAVNRTRRRFAGIYWDAFVSVVGAAFVVTGLAVTGIIRVQPWYEAQYAIPLLGMVLGNVLNGISLALDRFTEGVVARRAHVETLLALGASRWEAAEDLIREALRVGMIPTINSMMVMGVVSLPGMMTGQILAGAAPADAVRYQIVIVFMIASATALGATGVTLLAFRRLFGPDHRLRFDRLTTGGRVR